MGIIAEPVEAGLRVVALLSAAQLAMRLVHLLMRHFYMPHLTKQHGLFKNCALCATAVLFP